MVAHDPITCHCDNCALDREIDLIADFWSKAGQSTPARSRWWIAVDLAILALAGATVWITLFWSQPW